MDTSLKYIEMCHNAKPYFDVDLHFKNSVFYCKCGKKWEPISGHNPIKAEGQGHWRIKVFSQDDIQAFIMQGLRVRKSNMGLLRSLTDWLERSYPTSKKWESMEQIWLGYLMASFWLKTWDGRSGWINSSMKTKITRN